MRNGLIQIGELARRSGLPVSKIRYYETLGLLTSLRSNGGTRLFARADNRRLGFISIAQSFGYSLQDIKTMLDRLPNNRTPNRSDWAEISAVFQERIDERIAELNYIREKLEGCIGCGCLSLDRCALYNKDDEAAKLGQGAVFVFSR